MNFYLTTVLVAIASCTLADAYVLVTSKDSAVASLEQKCSNNAHNNHAFRDLTNAFEYLPECIANVMGNPVPNVIEDYNLFCQRIGSPDYYVCIDNFVKKASPCLDEVEAYLPDFLITAYNVSLQDCCGEKGQTRVNEMINDITSSTCGMGQRSLQAMHTRCMNDLIIIKNIEDGIFTIKKEDLCSDIRSWKECMIQSLQNRCREDHTETLNFVMDAFLVTC